MEANSLAFTVNILLDSKQFPVIFFYCIKRKILLCFILVKHSTKILQEMAGKLLFLSQAKNIVHNGVKSIMKSNWNCSFNIQITKDHKSTFESSNETLKRFWLNCVTLQHKTSIFKTKISQSNIILVFSCQERKYRTKTIAVFFHSIYIM